MIDQSRSQKDRVRSGKVLPLINIFFPEADFEARDELHSEHGAMSDNDLIYPVFSGNVQLTGQLEHHKDIVETPRHITVLHVEFSPPVCIPLLYSCAAPHVAYPKQDLIAT